MLWEFLDDRLSPFPPFSSDSNMLLCSGSTRSMHVRCVSVQYCSGQQGWAMQLVVIPFVGGAMHERRIIFHT